MKNLGGIGSSRGATELPKWLTNRKLSGFFSTIALCFAA
jgi:hypothetical protein